MSAQTVSFARIYATKPTATKRIYSWSYWFKVFGIYAQTITTQMIYM